MMIYNGVRGGIRACSKVGKLQNLSPTANPLEHEREDGGGITVRDITDRKIS
jgi:hypothetical protein